MRIEIPSERPLNAGSKYKQSRLLYAAESKLTVVASHSLSHSQDTSLLRHAFLIMIFMNSGLEGVKCPQPSFHNSVSLSFSSPLVKLQQPFLTDAGFHTGDWDGRRHLVDEMEASVNPDGKTFFQLISSSRSTFQGFPEYFLEEENITSVNVSLAECHRKAAHSKKQDGVPGSLFGNNGRICATKSQQRLILVTRMAHPSNLCRWQRDHELSFSHRLAAA